MMANLEHLAKLEEGVEAWNKWRKEAGKTILPDLSGANLDGAELQFANLTDANLCEAMLTIGHLSHANLTKADFSYATLTGTNFSFSKLVGAKFEYANLKKARLRGANLDAANLSHATLNHAYLANTRLNGAEMTDAELEGTTLVNVDLSTAAGLETVNHKGPSSIGIDTIYKSGGKIPEVFLRGAGVPQPFITHMTSLVAAMEPIQFYSCFISYSNKDQDFAARLTQT
jgi:hypothetical protein